MNYKAIILTASLLTSYSSVATDLRSSSSLQGITRTSSVMHLLRSSVRRSSSKLRWLSLHLLLVTFVPQALAQADFTDERLAGLELEYVGRDLSGGKASVYLDLTYWHLFASHQKGWNGGDGVYSTTLPDGNSFWSFGDSFFGLISEFRDRRRPANLPRNAAMVQTGERSHSDFHVLNELCSTDPNDRERYYKGKTWLRHPNAKALSQSDIDNGSTDSDRFYWPGDATVIHRDGKPILQVLWGSIFGNMNRDETALSEHALEGTPGDGEYMRLLRLIPNVVDYSGGYGSGIIEAPDGHTDLYGTTGTASGFGSVPVVARTATHDLTSTWEYWISDGKGHFAWQTATPTTAEIQRSDISHGEWVTEPSMMAYGDYYYMVSQDGLNGNIYIYQASDPWGPFENRKCLYNVPDEHANTYNAFVHPQLSRTGELVISYNMNAVTLVTYHKNSRGEIVEDNADGFWRNFNAWGSADLYQPHFIRVFGWQSLFGVPDLGPVADAGIIEYEKMKSHE